MSSIKTAIGRDTALAFAATSVLLLAALAIAPAKDHFSEWKQYQRGYLKFVSGRADGRTLARRLEPGIQQTWNPNLSVTDRCATCHVAMKEASLADAAQPFRPHRVIPHKLDEFGCVMCHRGQGAATTVAEAHNSTKQWEQPILPARYIESGCGQCHLAALPGTPHLNRGRTMLSQYGCVRCHSVRQPDGTLMQATDDPPSLEHIADKTSREWIYAWIKNPQAYAVSATMPNFALTDDEARDISAFLIAQSSALLPAHSPAQAAPVDAAAAASLYGQSFCASCHAMQNAAGNLVGGNIGPELTRVGSKAKPQWLESWLRNPNDYDPDTRMPHYRFDDKQIALLAGFLESKTDSDLLSSVQLSPATPQQVEHGKQLVNEYGCAVCHRINGVKRPENFAPELDRVGSKSLALLAFPPGVPETIQDYIAAKLRNPRSFGPSLKMPKFALSEQQIADMTTALLAQTDRAHDLPPQLRVSAVPESKYQPAGAAGHLISDLRCFSCHAINGRGGDMAPDLTTEGSSVQRAWLEQFLKNPNTLRPALIRRMPRFNLSDAEIRTLSDYIMAVYQTPAFDSDQNLPSSPALVEQGHQLFYAKYACQSCHIVDFNKDKGYVGPSLAQVGLRLTPAWTYHWLKDPQALRPGTLEPNQHISDADAQALTAYLMSLKAKQGGGK